MVRPLLAAALLVLADAARAQAPATADVPTPEAFLPDYGRAFTPHHRLVAYFEAVAAASPRVTVERYGETYEGRPLILAYVSSEANLADLDGLRRDHLRRSGRGGDEAPADAEPKAVVWLSYSVHGNELAGAEASPTVLYALATATDSLADALANTLVILDPSLNPDGYTRYTDDYRRRAGRFPDADPDAWEHAEPWPGGRTNHYLFDLNRDWVWASQTETRARLAAYRRWMPHVHADLHEMGVTSSYYFAPAAEPLHEYVTDFQRDFQAEVGRYHARVFDANGWLYYTRERFDLLYPSYGDTYPTFNGAIGMTYEQAGSGRAGRAYARPGGDTLTIADRIAHHAATSLSTVAVASRHADRLAAEAAAYHRGAAEAPRGEFAAYVFPRADNPPARLRALAELLRRHDIPVHAAAAATSVRGEAYGTGARRERRIAAGDVVVSARLAGSVLAQVLLDPATRLRDSLTYDITAWSLPLVAGLEGFAALGEVGALLDVAPDEPRGPAEAPAYGFAAPVTAVDDWAVVAPALRAGAAARYAPLDITTADGQTLPAGTLLFLARDQPSARAYADAYAALRGGLLAVTPLRGGLAASGPDLGADGVRRVDAPTVALLQDDDADPNALGHAWHFLERRLGYPARLLPLDRLDAEALAAVDVLVIPDGRYGLTGRRGDALEAWVRGGGRVVAMQGGAEALARRDAFALETGGDDDAEGLQTVGEAPDPMAPYAERERTGIAREAPGALVAAEVDRTHPLAFGLGAAPVYVLRDGNRPWGFLEAGANVVGVREGARVVGFVGSAIRDDLDETLALGVQALGRGDVVYAADDLAYRGFWERGMHLLANAIFYR